MELHKIHWSWKEAIQFALCWELRIKDNAEHLYSMNKIEALGSWILSPLFKTLNWLAYYVRRPLAIVLTTLFLVLCIGIMFYKIPAFIFLGKILPAKLIRFLFFIYTEILLLGMGCNAFGRFHNRYLVDLWKQGKLAPLFPGGKQR